ncbi:MAG: DUF4920 domain-containing protein [Gemmatimonadetes bacterium]|nr:DUF4920 domain-containing protein [Gemmatimonadota bacterium]MYF18963.1 DUF4920 domain-containing protein [Gemmatimonadota bacterium]
MRLYLLLLVLIIGCDSEKMHQVGEAVPANRATRIKEVLDRPAAFLDQRVVLSGRVGQVCQHMGCWFVLQDNTQHILIDLEQGRTITVPRNISGDSLRVVGVVKRIAGNLRLTGKGVEIHRKRAKIWSFFNL